MGDERRWDLDAIRIIACFFVVLIHVAGYGMEAKNPMTADWMIRNVVVCFTKCAAPIFFMISGILFMEKELTIRLLYKKYILRIVIIGGIWSALYAGIDYIAYLNAGGESMSFFLVKFFSGHYHLWFLPSLLIAYALLPILQRIVSSCQVVHIAYMGAIVLIGVIVKETFDPFFQNEVWDSIWDNRAFPGVAVGVIYFVLGYYLDKYADRISRMTAFLFGAAGFVLMTGINVGCAYYSGEHSAVASGYLTLWVLMASVGSFVFLIKRLREYKFDSKYLPFIKNISDCTFGIYLLHTLFIEQVYRRVGLTQDKFPVVVSIFVFSILTFLISYAIVFVIKKIPVLGKWVV